jgi:hypothetical protein
MAFESGSLAYIKLSQATFKSASQAYLELSQATLKSGKAYRNWQKAIATRGAFGPAEEELCAACAALRVADEELCAARAAFEAAKKL